MATPTLNPGASLIVHDESLQTFSLAHTNCWAATPDLKKRRRLPSLVGFYRTRHRNCGLDIRNYDTTPWKVSFFSPTEKERVALLVCQANLMDGGAW